MADDRATRCAKPAISHLPLHNLSNIYNIHEKHKKPAGNFFEAERIIERRKGRNGNTVFSLPETIKEKSTYRAKALCRELVVGGWGKPCVFLYKLIQKHHVTK